MKQQVADFAISTDCVHAPALPKILLEKKSECQGSQKSLSRSKAVLAVPLFYPAAKDLQHVRKISPAADPITKYKAGHHYNMTGTPSQRDRETIRTWPGHHHMTGTPSQRDRDTITT